MIRPGWLAVALTVLVIAIAVTCATRLAVALRRRRGGELDADAVHVLAGVAMAGMFLSGLTTLPGRAWEAVFAAGAAWFAWRAVRVRQLRPAAVPAGPAARGAGADQAVWVTARTAGTGPAAADDASEGEPGSWIPGGGADSGQHGTGRLCAHPLPHLIDCLAMVYALWAVPAVIAGARAGGTMGSMGMAGGARLPLLGLVLAVCVCGYVVWLGDRLQVGPRIAGWCTIGMGVAMGVMLIDLL
jgi:hypothetical protein